MMSLTKIDVHTHVVPPFWSNAVDAAGKIPSPPVSSAQLFITPDDAPNRIPLSFCCQDRITSNR